ncbi:MAG TPA: ABC transporter ATP-binding protein [Candidatus Coproplasma stercoripullorum]|uniref:ABC transporter ATP-binding protein n=1 Tax=Candidatus Coproplasma stercoripullorum TaxID=2840751 RepID=A0A9D1AF26_9FIRM|nr:ABC transporter ATP-binding protein [Candidatus Coproplasma stercoripullorum]
MLSIRGLSKRYMNFSVEDVTFKVPDGTVVGLIGENGAGKSTIIKSVLGAVHPDGGEILVDGMPLDKLDRSGRQKISFVLDDMGLPMELTLSMLDKVLANIFEKWDSAKFKALVQKFGLPEKKMLKEFSKGMKMKATIAVALSYESNLLILDEPTSGLDPVVRDDILEMIYDYNRQNGRAALISSHITTDLEKICDYIVYIHGGKVIFNEEKDELLSRYAIYSTDEKQLAELDKTAVVKVLHRDYGVDILASKEKMPRDFEYRPVSLDDIMLFYSKGESIC